MIDLGVHKLDSACWILDDHVVAVSAEIERSEARGVERRGTAVFTTSRGVNVTVDASWEADAFTDELRIDASEGWVHVLGKEELRWAGGDGTIHEEMHPAPRNAAGTVASGVFARFVAAMTGESSAGDLPSFDQGAAHVRAILAAYESNGRTMPVADGTSR